MCKCHLPLVHSRGLTDSREKCQIPLTCMCEIPSLQSTWKTPNEIKCVERHKHTCIGGWKKPHTLTQTSRDLMRLLWLIGAKITCNLREPFDSPTHTHITRRVLSLWCLMEPSYGLLIGRTTVRLIYSSNQALINSRTLVRPPLKLMVITHSRNIEETNNQKMPDVPTFGISSQPRTQIFLTEFSVKEKNPPKQLLHMWAFEHT